MMDVIYHGAVVTLQLGTVRTRLQANLIYSRLGLTNDITPDTFYEFSTYTRFLTQATIKGHIGFDVPSIHADEKALREGLENFLDAPDDFYDTVITALNNVDGDLNEDELTPSADPNE